MPEETIRAPRISAVQIRGLQDAINSRQLVALAQPRSKGVTCQHKELHDDAVRKCGELAAFQHVDEDECPTCGKMQKEVEDKFCVAHSALKVAGELQAMQISFDEVDAKTGAAPARRDPEPAEEAAQLSEPAQPAEAVADEPAELEPAPVAYAIETSYAMVPSEEDPQLCICGWVIASPAPGHDARHARFEVTPHEMKESSYAMKLSTKDPSKCVCGFPVAEDNRTKHDEMHHAHVEKHKRKPRASADMTAAVSTRAKRSARS